MKKIDRTSPQAVLAVAKTLDSGGVVALETDTIFGLSTIATPQGKEKLDKIKNRATNKDGYIRLVTRSMIPRLISSPIPPSIDSLLPGPITIIGEARDKALESPTLALRCPNEPFLIAVLECLKHPIYSTSANKSGSQALLSAKEIEKEFSSQIDLLVESTPAIREPSVIVDITGGEINVIRGKL